MKNERRKWKMCSKSISGVWSYPELEFHYSIGNDVYYDMQSRIIDELAVAASRWTAPFWTFRQRNLRLRV